MHVAKIVRKHQGKTYVSHLLRQSYRQDGQVKHRTLGNLSPLPPRLIDLVRRSLRGEALVGADQAVRTLASKPPGHVEAVRTTMRQRDMVGLLARRLSFPVLGPLVSRPGRGRKPPRKREDAL